MGAIESVDVRVERLGVAPLAGSAEGGRSVRVPLDGDDGVLELRFSSDDIDQSADVVEALGSLAVLSGFALGVARYQAERDTLAALRDRDRIASQLHDTVLQDVYAASLRLAGVAAIAEPLVGARIEEVLGAIDRSIRDLRQAVYGIYRLDGASFIDDLAGLVRSASAALGFAPVFAASVPEDLSIEAHVLVDVAAVVQEALSNVARHSGASAASVELRITTDRVVVEILDNGVGVRPGRRIGLGGSTMARRAERHGGWCRVSARAGGGTSFLWSVPRG